MKQRKGHRWIVVMLAVAGLLAGCSDDMPDTSAEANEIRFRADVWRVMEGTRATTFDNAAALQSEGSFTAAVYTENTTTQYVSTTAVDWNGSTSKWEFASGKHYWPMSGALDFFAYMPAAATLSTDANYINSLTYTVIDTNDDGDPDKQQTSFSCSSLPMTHSGQSAALKEFVYAMLPGRTKALDGASGVTLTFKHPFARINFKLAASHPDITINSITLKNLKNNGSYVDNITTATWTPSGDNIDFVATYNQAFTKDASAQTIGVPYLMVPQSFAGGIEVDATWKEWDEDIHRTVTATLPVVTWQAGYSYTYTFTITENDLKVSTEKYTEQW